MRKTWVIIFMILYSVIQAQNVPIPDSNFKSRVLASSPSNPIAKNQYGVGIKVDTNNDGQIQVTEAQAVVILDLNTDLITNLSGLSYFSSIKELYTSNQTLTSVTIGLPNLEYLIAGGSAMTTLDISACPKLNEMVLRYNGPTLSVNNNSVKKITLTSGSNTQNINLQGFTALKDFTLQNGPNVQNVNGSNMPSLESAYLSYAPVLSQINFTGSPNFKVLSVLATGLPSLDLTNYTSLVSVAAQVNTFSTVKFDGCTSLLNVTFYNNTISSISMNGASALETLTLNQCNLASLALNNLPGLKNVDLSNNLITNLNLINLPNLEKLDVTSNQLSSLDLTGAINIKKLTSSHNNISNLSVALLTQLMNLKCDYNALVQLDLSNNKYLAELVCNNNPNLEQIFLKNGERQYSQYVQLYPNPKLQYICCDDQMELADFTSYAAANGNPNTIVNSYCYFTPGNAIYTIQGNIKYDSNNNGCDSNDPGKGFQRFIITSGNNTGTMIANNSGNYLLPVQEGSHTIKPVLENPYFTITPASSTITFPAQTSPVTQNFCLAANGIHNDLETVIIPLTAATPGFDSKYKIIYKNKGTASQSGNISFTFNDDVINYINATVAPLSQSTGTLNWSFTNLLPFEKREIILTFNLNSPTQTPALNSGDILSYKAQINGASDETPTDNISKLNQVVVNSFDPNDKTCLEGTSITQTQVGDYVHYLIRFENTGTANARNIVVKDIIDTSKFDLTTLVPLDASHSFVTKITNPNVVEFVFDNIQLPFDDAHNDGYVSFKIKTKSTLVSGNNFSNTAKIYFDYNAPIITNTFTTAVEGSLATSEIKTEKNAVGIYPNPAKEILFIQSPYEITKVAIYDMAGRIVTSMGIKGNSVNVSELSKGNYILKVFTKDHTFIQKFIKE